LLKTFLIACVILAMPVQAASIEAPQVEVVKVNTIPQCNQFRHLVEKYDWDTELVMKIMELESSCNPNAVGDGHLTFENGTKGMSCGLMQVRVLEGRPDCETLKNPETNLEWAYKIFKERENYTAWSVLKKAKLALEK
jgi:soluble lytic murein transglycosylase-like protein